MQKKIRLKIDVIPHPFDDVIGRKYPSLAFNILPNDIFFFGSQIHKSSFDSMLPMEKRIFFPYPFREWRENINHNSDDTKNKQGVEIRFVFSAEGSSVDDNPNHK